MKKRTIVKKRTILKKKTIALVAHDNRKPDLAEWVAWNYDAIVDHDLVCTGTTGRLMEETLAREARRRDRLDQDKRVTRLKSGPLGGDLQLGAMISEGRIDMLIFLWDPMQPQPHDVDVKALLRIAVLANVPTATNRATADFLISSPLLDGDYEPVVKDYAEYLDRELS